MLAGYETTSTTLSYCTYVLVKHPEEQQKLFDEVYSFFRNISDGADNIEPNADNVNKLEYLDMFIKEVLRMFPIANRFVFLFLKQFKQGVFLKIIIFFCFQL